MPRAKKSQALEKAVAAQAARVAPKLMSDKDALEYMREHLPQLIQTLLDMATVDKDRYAVINLIDRVLGKPTERLSVEQTGEFNLNIQVKKD